jgi:hypothetical protein
LWFENLWRVLEECVVLVCDELELPDELPPHADTATALAASSAARAADSLRRLIGPH